MGNIRKLYFAVAIAVIVLVGVVIANVPPPPANQNIGIDDTIFTLFEEADCRQSGCHNETDPLDENYVPNRHHVLTAPPPTGEGLNCTDCHAIIPDGDGGTTVEIIRNCMNSTCHGAASTPHHNTTAALALDCWDCHGSLVADPEDYVAPSYPISMITPETSYKIINATDNKKWGGCEACHEAGTDTESGVLVKSNAQTHHNLGNTTTDDCTICHFGPGIDFNPPNPNEALDIRVCEMCHNIATIHNIQYNYGVSGFDGLGYGHIGDDWDCKGCHAWYVAYDVNPFLGNVIPSADTVTPNQIIAGTVTVISIDGVNFETTGPDGTFYTSVVELDNGVATTQLATVDITESQITATVPGTLSPGHYAVKVVKGDETTNKMSLMILPEVRIDSATIVDDTVVITGYGFGDTCDPLFSDFLGVTILHKVNKNKIVELPTDIVSWSDTQIRVNCPDASSEDVATVNALFGSASVDITDDSNPTPTPTPRPRPTKKPKPPKK